MKDVISHYDKLIQERNDPFRDPPYMQAYMDLWDGPRFIDAMGLDGTKRVLEIGVGTGRLAAKVAPNCLQFTGIDISPKTIERAEENLSGFKNVELICSDFMEYEFDGKFDVIYSSLTMMHFEDKAAVISKGSRLLCEHGIFCLSLDKNQSGWIDMGSRKIRIYPDDAAYMSAVVQASDMVIAERFETEFADILVCFK